MDTMHVAYHASLTILLRVQYAFIALFPELFQRLLKVVRAPRHVSPEDLYADTMRYYINFTYIYINPNAKISLKPIRYRKGNKSEPQITSDRSDVQIRVVGASQ